jgi:hypothetical protein
MSFYQSATFYFAGEGCQLLTKLRFRQLAECEVSHNVGFTLSAEPNWLAISASGKYYYNNLIKRECWEELMTGTYACISHCTMDEGMYLTIFINGKAVHEQFQATWSRDPWIHWAGGSEANKEFFAEFWRRQNQPYSSAHSILRHASPRLKRWLTAKDWLGHVCCANDNPHDFKHKPVPSDADWVGAEDVVELNVASQRLLLKQRYVCTWHLAKINSCPAC